jgi:hypothetical protein
MRSAFTALGLAVVLAGPVAAVDLPEIQSKGTIRVIASEGEQPEMFSFTDSAKPGLEREMLRLGLSTWAEAPFDNPRSDCHAWSAHPNYDLLTIVAGIRPAAPGFKSVRIAPSLGRLGSLEATMPHPAGAISVAYKRKGDALEASVTLPAGVYGELLWRGKTRALQPGPQALRVE